MKNLIVLTAVLLLAACGDPVPDPELTQPATDSMSPDHPSIKDAPEDTHE